MNISPQSTSDHGTLYLIPCPLGEPQELDHIPSIVRETIPLIDVFLVEEPKIARRFISALKLGLKIEDLVFIEVNKDTPVLEQETLVKQCLEGKNLGIISGAGCPGIADPGSVAVKIAHRLHISVKPLAGPSSIYMSLMASGFSGQTFTFHGYLPIENSLRKKKLVELEKIVLQTGYTQMFIETPYRNEALFADLLHSLQGSTKLCIGTKISTSQEEIVTRKIQDWAKHPPKLSKLETIFLIGV